MGKSKTQQNTAKHSKTQQNTAKHSNTQQNTATHRNTQQHTADTQFCRVKCIKAISVYCFLPPGTEKEITVLIDCIKNY